jgi:DNA-binding MarR family transcriptional regulator
MCILYAHAYDLSNVNEREDLGAQLARATRRLIALERPVLDEHGVTMWEYVALLRLRTAPARTQLQLAQAIGYDKTRLIALLDGLAQRGLITRDPSPEDRRARTVTLTPGGHARLAAIQRDIHRMEGQLLADEERRALEQLLDRL